MKSRGFSLVEVVVGVALLAVAISAMTTISLQLSRIRDRYAAQSRLETTVTNLLTDARAVLRYDGPAAQALQAGLFPSAFTVYQWEPDLAKAPVQCTAQHLTTPNNSLNITCGDRHGITITCELALDRSQPFPSSLVTAPPTLNP